MHTSQGFALSLSTATTDTPPSSLSSGRVRRLVEKYNVCPETAPIRERERARARERERERVCVCVYDIR